MYGQFAGGAFIVWVILVVLSMVVGRELDSPRMPQKFRVIGKSMLTFGGFAAIGTIVAMLASLLFIVGAIIWSAL